MGMREKKEEFATEQEARDRLEQVKRSAIPGYSEVYTSGPFNIAGVWMIHWSEHYG